MELEDMKKQLNEKSSQSDDKKPHSSDWADISPTTLEKIEKTPITDEHRTKISGTAMHSSKSLDESQQEDLQAANCAIS